MRHRIAIIAIGLAAVAAVAAVQHGDGGGPAVAGERDPAAPARPADAAAERASVAVDPPRAAPDRAPDPRDGHLVAKVRAGRRLIVRASPGGRVVGRIGDRTDFGSRTALAVLETRRGRRWLGVATTARPHGLLGWIRADRGRLAYARIRRSLHVDLSERRLELREGERVLRRIRVGVGRPGTPTPVGRFGVTDRMLGEDFGWWYGCCIIAFSARQPQLPPGWQGGDRVAIHGAPARSTIGAPSTAGCLRAGDAVLRRLMVEVPLGTPVFIRA